MPQNKYTYIGPQKNLKSFLLNEVNIIESKPIVGKSQGHYQLTPLDDQINKITKSKTKKGFIYYTDEYLEIVDKTEDGGSIKTPAFKIEFVEVTLTD
jgi:hypothetical protein